MRSKGVRLALYDEPSASLDPKAEFGEFLLLLPCREFDVMLTTPVPELFERLRAMKGQRTMLFITQYVSSLVLLCGFVVVVQRRSIYSDNYPRLTIAGSVI